MTLTDRDRKIAMVLIPVLLVAACWFVVLAPKRSQAADLGDQLAMAEGERDTAVAEAGALENAKVNYAKDYETVVRLGKAIPSSVDMPSLLVQLDRATRGTDIRFGKIAAGARTTAPVAPVPTEGAEGTPAAAPGGEAAQTAPGTAAESAGEAVQTSDQASAAAGADTTATTSTEGTPTGGTAAPGLDTVPLDFTFSGGFFEMADFFHEMKRFVYLANKRVRVQGRLMQIDGFSFEATNFPTIKAEVQATVYLAPKSEGTTAGATPAGPPITQQAAADPSSPAPATPPAATPVDSTGGIQ